MRFRDRARRKSSVNEGRLLEIFLKTPFPNEKKRIFKNLLKYDRYPLRDR